MIDESFMKYLAQFGYLQPAALEPNSGISDSEMKTIVQVALIQFQQFFNLSPTGKMDDATEKAMHMPRCGMKDMLSSDDLHTRRQRYTFLGGPWLKRDLTFSVHHYSQNSSLVPAAVDEEIALAFAAWANVTDLVFRQVSGKADINISFFTWEHGDGYPFDGPGMILGHASLLHGMVHFDDDEPWTIRRDYGRNLFLVALHELGHALGLDHSIVRGSVMQPMFNRGYEPNFIMHFDDIEKVQVNMVLTM